MSGVVKAYFQNFLKALMGEWYPGGGGEALTSFEETRKTLIEEWGELGSRWGISRTMARAQALLMIATEPLNTDQVMEALAISRGNAHGGLEELVSWGLARKVHREGDRKVYFEALKDPWQIFFVVARERRRLEIEPVLAVLRQCEASTRDGKTPEETAFHQQIQAMTEFTATGDAALQRIAEAEKRRISKWLLRLIGRQ